MSEDEILLQDGNVYRRLGKHSMRVGSAVYEVMDVELIGNQRKMDLREELTPATWLSEEMAEWFDLNEADSMSALPDLTDEQVIGASWSMVSGVRDLDDWRFIALQDELANRYDSVGLVHQEMSQLALNPDLDEDQQMMANRRRRHAGSVLAMIADARYLIGDTADRLRNKGRFANMTLTELVEAWYDAPSADSAMSRTAIRNELDNRGIEHHVSGGHLLATDEQRRAWEELSHLNGPELIEAFNQWYGMAEQPKLKSMFRKLLRAKIKIGEELGNYSDHLMRALRAALAKAEM